MSGVTDSGLLGNTLRRGLLWLLAALLLVACQGSGTAEEPPLNEIGSSRPDVAVQGFFQELGQALRDRQLPDPDVRERWVERLASYFAPNERDAQRDALDAALSAFASGLAQLTAEQTLTFEINGTNDSGNFVIVASDERRALVRVSNVTIHVVIARSNIIDMDQEVPLEKIIDRSDGTVPTLNVGGRWYLTEG
ncbi:MAG TPA: hypothetical protein VFS21_21970 [Roseiflexaceae bacterium]|nr:hypothetical protein [Roseiflexaceae bacterium]